MAPAAKASTQGITPVILPATSTVSVMLGFLVMMLLDVVLG